MPFEDLGFQSSLLQKGNAYLCLKNCMLSQGGLQVKVEAKCVVGVFLILMILLGVAQLFVPVTKGQQGSLVVDRAYWLSLANNAWKYYQPGFGVDSTTGLHGTSQDFPYFTDWDLGVYIQSIIDANKLGIINKDGIWGAEVRFNKILTFLQNRPLSSNGIPYVWYQATNGNPHLIEEQNAADSGQLLVALNNLRVFRPDLADAVNNIVFNRTNYAPMKQAVDALANSKNLYDYYVARGFAGFWPSRFSKLADSILNNIVSSPTVSTYGVLLPSSKLTCEPLLLSVFNLAPNSKLEGLAYMVYLAHEARYNATGKFTAFSEGNTDYNKIPYYVYEWVVREDGSTWTIEDGVDNSGFVPIIYFKAAVGLLAIHNTPFSKNMVLYIESHLSNPKNGYSDGIDENGRVVTREIDKTNGMIIGAAIYAISNQRSPTSIPTPTPSPVTGNPTSIPTPTPSPVTGNPTSIPTPTPSPVTGNPTSIPTPTPSPVTGNPTSIPTPTPSPVTGNPTSIPTPTPSPVTGNPTSIPTPTPSPVTGNPTSIPTPTPVAGSTTLSPTLSPLENPTPSPSSSDSVHLTNQLASWSVFSFIVVLIVVGYAGFILLVNSFKEKNHLS